MNNKETDQIVFVPWQELEVAGHRAIEYREVNISELERRVEMKQTALEQEAELHTDDCGWWQDWHACNCGAFDR